MQDEPTNAELLTRIQELEQEIKNLHEKIKVKTKLEEPAQNKWDKVAKSLYNALT